MGKFEINEEGMLGALSVENPLFDVQNVKIGSDTVRVEINTRPIEQSFEVDLGMGTESITVPSGPYVRVASLGTEIEIEDISLDDGSSVKLEGDFYFDRAGDVIRLAMEELKTQVQANGNKAELSDGYGALVVNSKGVAGIFEGKISAELAENMGANSKVFVRTNNTGDSVDEVIRMGEREVSINFGSDEGKIFLVTLDGFSLNIGNIVTVEGSFSFVSRDGFQVAAAKDATLFVGKGPAYLVDGKLNSEAVGVLIKEATIGIVKKVGEDGKALYAIDAQGDLEAIGVKDGKAKLSGRVRVQINMLSEDVDQTIRFPGEDDNVKVTYSGTEVAQGDDYYSSIVASGIKIEVLGQKLTGDVEIAPYDLNGDRGGKVTLERGLA